MVFVGKKFIFFPDPYPIVPCQVKPDQIKSKPRHQFERTTYMFIGRKTELDFLNKHHATESGQLIVLYGRRRVGKTETLLEFCKARPKRCWNSAKARSIFILPARNSRTRCS